MKATIPNIGIAAVSSCLPQRVLELASLAEEYGKNEVASIIRATGVERVRIADPAQTASDLCCAAARRLLDAAQLQPETVGGLVFVSQTPDYILPATSVVLQDRLGLGIETVCLDIPYGCSGYVYGLFQAALWISCGACKNVLVLAGDTTTKLINPSDRSLRMVFGDCGTATLVTRGTSPMGFSICSDGSGYDRLIIPAGGFRLPASQATAQLVVDADKNGRTQQDMYMDGMAIFDFALTRVHENINGLLDYMGWQKEAVGLFALHQANKFMLDSIRKKLKIAPDRVPVNVANYGNTGPATIPLLLSDMRPSPAYDLEKVIMCGFGVGLSWGSVACSLQGARFYEPVTL